jgi:hypothetical protein
MKLTKSQLRELIREEIKSLNENSNPELDKLVRSFVNRLSKKYGYSINDAIFAITQTLNKMK